MDGQIVRLKRRQRKMIKRPLWRRRPEVLILVVVGVGLAAVLIVVGVSGLIETMGDSPDAGAEEAPLSDDKTAEKACMEQHAAGAFGMVSDFKCEIPCDACHTEPAY